MIFSESGSLYGIPISMSSSSKRPVGQKKPYAQTASPQKVTSGAKTALGSIFSVPVAAFRITNVFHSTE
jgi:hypothetical protein